MRTWVAWRLEILDILALEANMLLMFLPKVPHFHPSIQSCLHRDVPGGLARAVETLRWTTGYVGVHEVSDFSREAAMATEMADLIAEKLELSRQVAALPPGATEHH